ncbi:MAG: hypothetical protein ABI430_04525 [Candidatus Taylorbacteria bacterium]
MNEPKSIYATVECPYCGNSPTNHFLAHANNTVFIAWNKVLEKTFLKDLDGDTFPKLFDPFFSRLEKSIFSTLCFFKVARFHSNIDGAADLRSRMIWLEAIKREIPMEQFVILGKATDWYRAKVQGVWRYFVSIPIPPRFPSEGNFWIDDKHILKEKLMAGGIPVPRSETATSEKSALSIFVKWQKPLMVKPRSGSRGRHTTTYILNREDFLLGFKRAQKLGHFVQVEEHLAGNVCRATIVDGVLRGFLKAESPRVIGDGIYTISELIEEKNKNKPDKIGDVIVKVELVEFVRRQGYELSDILAKGKTLPLLSRTGRLFGGRTKEMAKEAHPKLKDYLEKASKIIGTPLVGFDLIIENPESDPDGARWGIIEANSLPFIDLHEFALEGAPANIASYIWDLWP